MFTFNTIFYYDKPPIISSQRFDSVNEAKQASKQYRDMCTLNNVDVVVTVIELLLDGNYKPV